MTTHTDPDRALRDLIELSDPERDTGTPPTAHLLDRVLAAAAENDQAEATMIEAPALHPQRSFARRHWQGGLLLAAAACSLMLAAPTVLTLLEGTETLVEQDAGALGGAGAEAAVDSPAAEGGSAGAEGGYAGTPLAPSRDGTDDAATELGGADRVAPDGDSSATDSGAAAGSGASGQATASEEKLVRSGSVLVGTEDQAGARDRFVTAILALGGRVTSESVVTRDSSGGGVPEYAADKSVSSTDMDRAGASYPYPWYPTGPGIWISVQVPVSNYDEAMTAARGAGEVIQLQQSSYDVGTQVADVDARISSLEASLDRLNDLMDQAEDVSDVIALEKAISSRQAELDSLRAQQRDLANQTEMSALSLTLMSPTDAKASLEPAPPQTWWEAFVAGLAQFWAWLGKALLIVSPLLIAGAIILGVRRRRRGTATEPGAGEPGPATPA